MFPSETSADQDPRARVALILLATCVGVRVAQYLAARSLWLDEAMLALNIVGRSFGGLLTPLDETQTAPVLFLWTERLAALTLGANELALRLFPLLAGCLVPWLVWRAARPLVGSAAALGATAVVALSPALLYYSNEVKPYGVDACCAALLALLTVRTLEDPGQRLRQAALVAVGTVSMWMSYPAVFVVAACWLAMAVHPVVTAQKRVPGLIVSGAVWGASFLAAYMAIARGAASNEFLQSFWAERFLVPWTPGAASQAVRLWHELATHAFVGRDGFAWATPLLVGLSVFAGVACVAGVAIVARRRGVAFAVLLAGPTLLALIASALQLYPVGPKFFMFAVPAWAILVTTATHAGIRRIADSMPRMAPAATSVSAALLVPAMLDAGDLLARPYWRREHMRPVISALREQQRQSGEPVYVSSHGVAQWLLYATDWRRAPTLQTTNRDTVGAWLERTTCARAARSQSHDDTESDPAVGCQLLGRYSGVRYVDRRGFTGTPDTGWAASEVARLRSASTSCGWLLLHHPFPGEPAALARAIAEQGGRVDSEIEDRAHPNRQTSTRAFRACFASGERALR